MVYVILYGLLAVAAASIALAARNYALNRLGLLFFINWLAISVVFFFFDPKFGTSLSFGVDILSAAACFVISDFYKCRISQVAMAIYCTQAGFYFHILQVSNSVFDHVVLNALFVTNALLIIYHSLNILLSKEKRTRNIKCFKNDRRHNDHSEFNAKFN